MNIPQEAIETAIDKACATLRSDFTFDDIGRIVEAAAPLIQADVLRHAATCMKDPEDAAWLTSWADELEEPSDGR